MSPNELDPTPPVVKERSWKKMGCLGGLVAFVLFVAFGLWVSQCTESGRQNVAEWNAREEERTQRLASQRAAKEAEEQQEAIREAQEDLGIEAKVMCEDFVRDRLLAPATADFPWLDYEANCSGEQCAVRSYVDSENSFGAKLRTTYRCVVRKSGDRWELLELETS